MERLYIVDTKKPFNGTVLNSMPFVYKDSKNGADILNSTYVHYTNGVTFAQYNEQHGGGLIALTWDEFNEQYYTPYLQALQTPFEESTEEKFMYGLECVPPKRWTREHGQEFFFVGECYTADLYRCYVRKGKKYYSALRSIHTPAEKIFSLAQ